MLKIDAREVFCVCRGSHQVVELRKQIVIKKLRILRLSLCDSHSQELCLHDKTSPLFLFKCFK